MIAAISLFRTEMSKQVRRPRTYVALGIMVVLPVIMTIAVRFGQRAQQADVASLFSLARQSGFVMPAAALLFMSRFLLVVVVAIFAGDAVAGEATWGTLRYALVRPVGRARLLAGKLAMALVFVAIATLLIVLTGLVAGGLAFGWNRVDINLGSFFSLHKSSGQLLSDLGVASAYVAWGMTSVVAMALMVSTMTDSSNGAIGAGIGLFTTSEILNAIPQLGSIRNGLPTHYLDDWQGLIIRNDSAADLLRGALIQLPYIAVFLAIAFWYFKRKDVLS